MAETGLVWVSEPSLAFGVDGCLENVEMGQVGRGEEMGFPVLGSPLGPRILYTGEGTLKDSVTPRTDRDPWAGGDGDQGLVCVTTVEDAVSWLDLPGLRGRGRLGTTQASLKARQRLLFPNASCLKPQDPMRSCAANCECHLYHLEMPRKHNKIQNWGITGVSRDD